MVLTDAQATAIYDAMCALNNVDALLTVSMPGGLSVYQTVSGEVCLRWFGERRVMHLEKYNDQAAFVLAYKLEQ